MGRKKEAKPLLDKNSQRQSSSSTQQNTLIVKKIGKGGKPIKSKLSSVSEASVESGDSHGKEKKSKCLEKDVDESQQSENPEDQLTHPGDSKPRPPSFGVRSYLHHFYERVNNPSSDQVSNITQFANKNKNKINSISNFSSLQIALSFFISIFYSKKAGECI